MMKNKTTENLMKWASYCSVIVACTLIVVKVVSFFLTNSLALLSSLMDSGLDLGASIVSLIAIHQALVPADGKHRFGHGKAEALGGLIQGFIIFLSGLFLLVETIEHLLHPEELKRLGVGLGVMCLSILLTILLVSFQKYVIKKTNSLAVNADSAHYTGDVIMNIGVIVSMIFSYTLGWNWIDSLFAFIVCCYLFWTAFQIAKSVMTILMDEELSPQTRNKIKEIVSSHSDILGITDLRTRSAGICSFIQFSILLDEKTDFKKAHDICSHLEDEVKANLSKCEVFIHAEPKQ